MPKNRNAKSSPWPRRRGKAEVFVLCFMLLASLLGLCEPVCAGSVGGAAGVAPEPDFARFAGLSWEELTREFLAQAPGSAENVGIAYYNTVTGEYHSYQGDRYFYAASLYKLPLNMYFAEKIYRGEMSFDDKIYGRRYGNMQKASLQFSSNPESESLMGYLGGGKRYLDALRPYLAGEDEDYDFSFLRDNRFTPCQMLHALRLLYETPERFPDVLYYLGQATQNNFFCKYETRFPIAHKYGWLSEEGITVVNDAGIIWTEEPILLVFMSNNNSGDTVTLGQYCVLMCDYCQYWHRVHLAAAEGLSGETRELLRRSARSMAEALRPAEEGSIPEAFSASGGAGKETMKTETGALRAFPPVLAAFGIAGLCVFLKFRRH